MTSTRKSIICNNKGAAFLRGGQMWMYKNNLLTDLSEFDDGEIVNILSESGEYIACGFLSKISHIVVRILSFIDEAIDEAYFANCIEKAVNRRRKTMGENFDNCRLIYSEADGLPGLIVDRYNQLLVMQISCMGMELRLDQLTRQLLKQKGLENCAVYLRNDIAVRTKEGLTCSKGFYCNPDQLSPQTIICENGLKIAVDVENGQKTGYFLDQKENRKRLREIAKEKRVLDCFCHTGGFGLNAAYGNAKKVCCVDVSAIALKQAENNAKMNQLQSRMAFVRDDVFHYLDQCKKGQYDIIVLDPPAFTKSRKTVDHAYQGYLEINTKGFSLLNKGGILISCSCSRYMEKEMFEAMLVEAAQKANVKMNIISRSFGSIDHPVNEALPESLYLKFYIMEVH